jgi:cytochrome P450
MSQRNSTRIPDVGTSEWLLDPSPWYNYMRRNSPIFFAKQAGSFWVFKYSDVENVLKTFKTFSSQFGGYEASRNSKEQEDEISQTTSTIGMSMIGADPPLHTKLRNMVSKFFTPKAIESLEPRIAEIASMYIDQINGGSFDFISSLAEPLPITVISEMLGIPVSDRKKFKEWSDAIVGASEGANIETNIELSNYFNRIIEERSKAPKDDLISSVITQEVDHQKLSREEVIGFCILLLVAGNETTTNLLGNAMDLFSKHDSFAELNQDTKLIPDAIEEVLRFSSPVKGMFRICVAGTELGGKRIHAGQGLMAWIGSANRDETVFEDPDKFEIRRKPNQHITFGHGIHMCLGAPLARLESKVVLKLFVEKFGDKKITIDRERIEPVPSFIIHGLKSLPIRVE